MSNIIIRPVIIPRGIVLEWEQLTATGREDAIRQMENLIEELKGVKDD